MKVDNLKTGKVVLRGQEEDETVLCTSNSTYTLRLVENSNTCLVVCPKIIENVPEDSNEPSYRLDSEFENVTQTTQMVSGIVTCHYELLETAPRLHRLQTLLAEYPFQPSHDQKSLKETLIGLGKQTISSLEKEIQLQSSLLTGNSSTLHKSTLSNLLGQGQGQGQGQGMEEKEQNSQPTKKLKLDRDGTSFSLSNSMPRLIGYSFNDLCNIIQCSEFQLHQALQSLPAVFIRGVYVGFSPALLQKAKLLFIDYLSSILVPELEVQNTPISNPVSLVLSQFSVPKAIENLCYVDQCMSPSVAEAIITYFLDESSQKADLESCSGNSETEDKCTTDWTPSIYLSETVSLSHRMLVLVSAKQILSEFGASIRVTDPSGYITKLGNVTPYPASDFLTAWLEALPFCLVPKPEDGSGGDASVIVCQKTSRKNAENSRIFAILESFIVGVAVKVPLSAPTKSRTGVGAGAGVEMGYLLLDETNLPLDIRPRIATLFSMKPQWTKEELRPYLAPITTYCGITLEQLLLKETRALKQGDEVVHIAR